MTTDNIQFRIEHKRFFFWCDLLMVLSLLFNIGAIIITNALVFKTEPKHELVESNPVQATINNYETKPNAWKSYGGLIIHALLYTVMLVNYLWARSNTRTDKDRYTTLYLVIGTACITGFDFFNDLGFLIGKMIWGA